MLSAEPVLSRPRFEWQLRTRTLPLGQRTLVMGIVNVTPDSFSDGGAHASTQAAVDHALRLLDEGADILDIGGESTRPGSPAATGKALSEQEEQERVLPVVRKLLKLRPAVILSIDSYRAATAGAAIQAGAEIVNDVSGLLWDKHMAATVAALSCGLVLMHTRGLPSEWQNLPRLEINEVSLQIRNDLSEAIQKSLQVGIATERIVLDPGFGFGKSGVENWRILADLQKLAKLGFPLMVGLSRKGFLSPALPPCERDIATHAANALAIASGAHLVRVHDVAGARHAVNVANAFVQARETLAEPL